MHTKAIVLTQHRTSWQTVITVNVLIKLDPLYLQILLYRERAAPNFDSKDHVMELKCLAAEAANNPQLLWT